MAETLKEEAVEIFSKQLGPEHPNIGIITIGLAAVLNFQGKYAEADATYRRALNILQGGFGPESIQVVIVHNGIGQNLADQGRSSEAEASYREALEIGMNVNPEHSDVADSHGRLARLPESTLTPQEREEYFGKAIDILRNNEGDGSLRAAFFQTDLGVLLAEHGRDQEARDHFADGLATLAAALPADNPRYVARREQFESLFGGR
jgi:tetratricopeptide (TPR) repeat protein